MARRDSDRLGAAGDGSADATRAVLDNEAILAVESKLLGREQEGLEVDQPENSNLMVCVRTHVGERLPALQPLVVSGNGYRRRGDANAGEGAVAVRLGARSGNGPAAVGRAFDEPVHRGHDLDRAVYTMSRAVR